jgi:hypothetical protein
MACRIRHVDPSGNFPLGYHYRLFQLVGRSLVASPPALVTTMTRQRDIYRAIMIAAANGRGLHLTADEVWELRMDDAIATRANNTISEAEFAYFDHHGPEQFWRDAKPTV